MQCTPLTSPSTCSHQWCLFVNSAPGTNPPYMKTYCIDVARRKARGSVLGIALNEIVVPDETVAPFWVRQPWSQEPSGSQPCWVWIEGISALRWRLVVFLPCRFTLLLNWLLSFMYVVLPSKKFGAGFHATQIEIGSSHFHDLQKTQMKALCGEQLVHSFFFFSLFFNPLV